MAALLLSASVASGCGVAAVAPTSAGPIDDTVTCADPADAGVTITAPADGAAAATGPLTVVGDTTTGSDSVGWLLRDAQGVEAGSGEVDVVESDAGPVFTVPLDLAAGSYRLTVRPAGAPAADCDQVTVAVGDAGQPLPWTSGVSGDGAVDGGFAAWRDRPVPISGTWADTNDAQVDLYTLQPDGEFGSWTGDLDIAIGAIDRRQGESWAAAAQGAYDARWTESLQNMARLWAGRPGTLYIRFAHEFNGTWYPWSADATQVADFTASWKRFRALQQEIFPSSQLVFAPNVETVGDSGLDWRDAFPGAEYVDVMSTSFFNGYPAVTDAAGFWAQALDVDDTGAPRGVQRHLEFARSVGLPFAVSEWGGDGEIADSTVYWQQMFSFFNSNAGPGPGQVRYEVVFNVDRDDAQFRLEPSTVQPQSAEVYRQLW